MQVKEQVLKNSFCWCKSIAKKSWSTDSWRQLFCHFFCSSGKVIGDKCYIQVGFCKQNEVKKMKQDLHAAIPFVDKHTIITFSINFSEERKGRRNMVYDSQRLYTRRIS
jgi:hypothetical protein